MIAIYFSGRINKYEYCLENILYIKNKYNDVVFFMSLNTDEITEYHTQFMKLLSIGDDQYYYGKVNYPQYIYLLSTKSQNDNRENIYSQFYNNKKCIELIENYSNKYNVKFDCIMKYRADILTDDAIEFQFPLCENTIYIPKNYDFYGINDQIAYGSYNTMKIYSSIVNNILLYCEEIGKHYHPETLTLYNLQHHNINIIRFPFEYSLHPSRRE